MKNSYHKISVIALALFTLAFLGGCQKSESETAGRKLGSAVRGAAEDVKDGATKVKDGIKDKGEKAIEGAKEFGKGVKDGWKTGEK